jgi:dephospho-CoA kinase
MSAQMPVLQMMEYADDIIYNDGDVETLRSRVESLWSALSPPTPPRTT